MKYCLQYSDAIRKSNTDVYSGINQHCRKSAYFSVGPLESVSIGGVHKMEWQVASKRQHRKELEEKLAYLKYRLRLVTCQAQGVDYIKINISHLVEQFCTKQQLRSRVERDIVIAKEKVGELSDKIEKLMMHLNQKSIYKERYLTDQAYTHCEVQIMGACNKKISSRNSLKDRAILELNKGKTILQYQLHLIYDKYIWGYG